MAALVRSSLTRFQASEGRCMLSPASLDALSQNPLCSSCVMGPLLPSASPVFSIYALVSCNPSVVYEIVMLAKLQSLPYGCA
ncbi:unnamed protein product [Brassica napus]|uniref:(rape) hypothetical protein n=1 Tax=Brassica napus TaxID=3708 RepID=A0A816SHZ5_BRANA|nr:unnamed protein product [Brassica napus]